MRLRYKPEDSVPQTHRRDNLKFHIFRNGKGRDCIFDASKPESQSQSQCYFTTGGLPPIS
jgi:hypothetical protein